jgi:hypothetical protein
MSLRLQAAAFVLTAFAIALAILLWPPRETQHEQSPIAYVPVARSNAVAPVAPISFVSDRQTSEPVMAPSTPAGRAAAAADAGQPSFSDIEVPVFVMVRGQAATVRNASSRTMDVTITASNRSTGHQASAQVALSSFQRVDLDATEFAVERGDMITVHGPPFRDREIETPDN